MTLNHELLPKERARCAHSERTMAPSGRYSTCSSCLLEGVVENMKPVSEYGERPYLRFHFSKEISLAEAALLQIGFTSVARLPIEISREGDGMAVRIFSKENDAETLTQAADWFAGSKWKT